MNKVFPMVAALALFAAVLPATAVAQEFTERHLQILDLDGDGIVSKSEYAAFMNKAFSALDKNSDGILQPDEIPQSLTAQQVIEMDINGDGNISRSEFDAQVMKDFESADRTGNGLLQ